MEELSWWQATLWGAFGSILVDATQFYRVLVDKQGHFPENVNIVGLGIAEVIRIGIGAGLALAMWTSGDLAGPWPAVAVGVAAPIIVEHMSKKLPELPENNDTDAPLQ